MSFRKDTINGNQLAAKWDIDIHILSYLILKYDLSILDPPKNFMSKLFFKPNNLRMDTHKSLKIIQNNPIELYNKLFLADEIDKITKKIDFASLTKTKSEYSRSKATTKRCYRSSFDVDDIISGRRKKPDKVISRKKKKTNAAPQKAFLTNALKDVIEDHEGNIKKHPNVFSLIGKVWFVKFKKKEWGLYPDQQKYRYIAHLLSLPDNYPDEENSEFSIPNTDLVAKVKGKEITEESPAVNEQDGLNDSHLADNLSPEEIERFKEIGYDLLEKFNEGEKSGNQNLINDTQKQIDEYRSYLLNEYGIKATISTVMHKINYKRLYRPGKENEKIRQLVKNNTNNAINGFQGHMPKLGKHLKNSLKTKVYTTTYSPQTHINWHVST
jgi:hypothetical protein